MRMQNVINPEFIISLKKSYDRFHEVELTDCGETNGEEHIKHIVETSKIMVTLLNDKLNSPQ